MAGPPEELITKLPILESGLPAMLFSEGKKFHGSNSPSLFSRNSPLHRWMPMQILRTPDDHRNPSPTESHMAFSIPFLLLGLLISRDCSQAIFP